MIGMNKKIPTFLKWAGGKRKLLKELDGLMPNSFERYFEPFLGGGAMFFYVKQRFFPEYVMISDKNPDLINAYLVVKDNPEALMRKLEIHRKSHCKEYYYSVRLWKVEDLGSIDQAARFIYLNKTCFNGLYRVNSSGEFNVPIGKYTNPTIFDEKGLLSASLLLQRTNIKLQGFEKILEYARKGDFIYFDPCYQPKVKKRIFNGYTKDRFLESQQKQLAAVFGDLDRRGCLLMLSNSNTKFVKDLYGKYSRKTVGTFRSINASGADRRRVKELVIRNYN